MSVRTPPRRYDARSPVGICRLCAEPILLDGKPAKRRRWHPGCVEVWLIATSSEAATAALFRRDRGVCAACGYDCEAPANWRLAAERYVRGPAGKVAFVAVQPWRDEADGPYCRLRREKLVDWQGDHVVPLWSVDRDAEDAMRYWGLENLQTLCTPCHLDKTAAEAAQRAKELRLRQKAAGTVTRRKKKIPSRPFGKSRPPRGTR